jgi:hypothetical protein
VIKIWSEFPGSESRLKLMPTQYSIAYRKSK